MILENTNTYARFDDEGNFVEYSNAGSLPLDVDEGEIDGYVYYRVFMQVPQNAVECPHNYRPTHEDIPILESIPDSELKRATLRMVLVAKEGEDLEEAERVTMQQLRDERDNVLMQTDYKIIVALESGGEPALDWKEYRQQLRDLPSTANVFNIIWPTPPE